MSPQQAVASRRGFVERLKIAPQVTRADGYDEAYCEAHDPGDFRLTENGEAHCLACEVGRLEGMADALADVAGRRAWEARSR